MKNHLCWIRRDLRLSDHHALSKALETSDKTYMVFIFDPSILQKLPSDDRRITFIIESLKDLEISLNTYGSSLIVRFGDPQTELEKVIKEFDISEVFYNRDYEPYAKARDEKVTRYFKKLEVTFHPFKDHVFYEKQTILTDKREIYKVFTPYKNKWIFHFNQQEQYTDDFKCNLAKLAKFKNSQSILNIDWYKQLGFTPTENVLKGGESEAQKILNKFKKYLHEYNIARDFPALEKTSNLSPYLRMGNISIREVIRLAISENNPGATTFLSELIWRDFYQMILDVYPKIEKHCFRPEYDKLIYENDKEYFERWKKGMTGYPLIDAAMRCLNETGQMHNRLRMVVASFLTKTLLVDWRWGEAYFAMKLLDYDMAANIGGWQWSASTGVDAQPYFRVFNPYNQSEKFDNEGDFIRLWCPELKDFTNKLIHSPDKADKFQQQKANCMIGSDYPYPIVSYPMMKMRALAMFKIIKE